MLALGIVIGVVASAIFIILAIGKTIQNYYSKKETDNGNS